MPSKWQLANPEKQRAYVRKYRKRKRQEDPTFCNKYNKARAVRHVYKWRAKNKEKYTAHNKVYRALKAGLLVKPKACSKCGGSGRTGRIEGHHPDYSKPLEVIWLCHSCHAELTKVPTT